MTSISDSTETAFILNMTSDPESRDLFDKLFTGKYFPPTIEAIVIAVYSILMVTGFLFNFLMIVVILSSENLRRMPFNLLLLNLCVANIMLSVFCMPFTLVTLLYRSYTYGAVLCKIIPSLQVGENSIKTSFSSPLSQWRCSSDTLGVVQFPLFDSRSTSFLPFSLLLSFLFPTE